MARNRTLLFLALIVFVGALVYVLQPPRAAPAPEGRTAAAPVDPLDAAPPAREPAAETRRVLEEEDGAAAASLPDGIGPGDTHLAIQLVAAGTGDLLGKVRVDVFPDSSRKEDQGRFFAWMEEQGWGERVDDGDSYGFRGSPSPDESDPLTSDAQGRVAFSPPTGIPFRIAASETRWLKRTTKLQAAFVAGERRSLRMEIEVTASLRYFGRVVEKDGGSPVPEAEIAMFTALGFSFDRRAMDSESGFGRKSPLPKPAATTGPDGRFELEIEAWNGAVLWVRKEGFAPVFLKVVDDHDAASREREIPLEAGATIEGIVSQSLAPLPGARISLSTDGYRLSQDGNVSTKDAVWRRKTGADGSYRISNLPPYAPLQVMVEAEDGESTMISEPLILSPGERRRLDLDLARGCLVTGWVMDQSGQPVANSRVVAMPASANFPSTMDAEIVFLRENYEDKAGETTSGENGYFDLGRIPAGDWHVGVLPEYAEDVDYTATGIPLHIGPLDAPKELSLRVWRGLSISGIVLGPSGEKVSEYGILAMQEPPRSFHVASSEQDGSFVVGPLIPGEYIVTTSPLPSGGASFAPGDPVRVEAGTEGLVLRLSSGGGIEGHTLDRSTGDPIASWISIARQGDFTVSFTNSDENGSFSHHGLLAGIFELCAVGGDGRIGILKGVELVAGQTRKGLKIYLAPGAALVITVPKDSPDLRPKIQWQGVWIIGEGFEPGVPSKVTVPAGEVSVSFVRNGETVGEPRTIHVAAGQTMEIEVPSLGEDR